MTSRWQQKRVPPNHADDWLMTYADMITLLLCFFAIIIIVSIPKKHIQPETPVQPAAAQRQQTPSPPAKPVDIFSGNLPFHVLEQPDDQAENTPESLPIKTGEAVTVPVIAPIAIQVPLPPPVLSLSQTADTLKSQGPMKVEQKGDRITTLEINSAAFFASGSATLSDAGMVLLQDVAAKLKSDQFKDYLITVEGHTDDTPIHTMQFPSNWELSTARASAVVHFFLNQGIPAPRLRAAGYADTFPKAPNRDSNGNPISANRAENRRVVINLQKIEKD